MILLIVISVLLTIISSFSKAICDLSEEGNLFRNKSINQLFWYKDLSWKNKWKGGLRTKGEKFWGSSRWFVMFTDAWHLFGFIFRLSFLGAFFCVGVLTKFSNYFYFGMLVNYVLFASVFHLFYNSKILRYGNVKK